MNYFQILCQNGCREDNYEPVIKLIANIFNLIKYFSGALFVIAFLYFLFVIIKKDKKYDKKKKIALIIMIVILVIFVLSIITSLVLNGMIPEKDELLNCWCK